MVNKWGIAFLAVLTLFGFSLALLAHVEEKRREKNAKRRGFM